ncbi:MAG TPA: DUF1269 domain-containing protein [Blastocatellia bacterium]|nr:DUF1269 domain-containing protein [Blastocatellia bacterium]
MNKMIVTVFNDETSAYKSVKALNELHAEGSLTVYGCAVVYKDPSGAINVKQAADEGPLGTFGGLAIGSLIGLLAGPVGMAVGAATGTLAGSLVDLARVGVNEDFLTEVYMNLVPGKWAVVAEVDEEWVTPLDTRMDAIGGVTFRRGRGEFMDAQIEREIAADNAEIDRLEAELKRAAGDAKTELKAKLDAARKKYEARRDLLLKRIDEIEREGEAKIKLLQQQMAKATGEAKANLQNRIAEESARHQARVAKLRQAWQLVQQAAAI